MDRKVMVALDGSEQSDFALQWYFQHIHNPANTVIVVYIADVHLESSFTFRPGLAISKEKWLAMQKILKQRVENIKTAIDNSVRAQPEQVYYAFHHLEGEPGTKICQFAQEEKVNIIVTGTRGLGMARRTILGSVSDYVLHHAHCPVVICRR